MTCILDLALDGSEQSSSTSDFFYPTFGETDLSINRIRGWVGPRIGLDLMTMRYVLPLMGIKPQLSSA